MVGHKTWVFDNNISVVEHSSGKTKIIHNLDLVTKIDYREKVSNQLMRLCFQKHVAIQEVKNLIAKGADVNFTNNSGSTPLLRLCFAGANKELIEFLIKKGADVNATDNLGDTPLTWGCRNNSKDVAELLINKGADVNVKDMLGHTPLYLACLNNNRGLARLLIEKGADANAQDNLGGTPLMQCVRWQKNTVLAELLITKGADVNAKNSWGETPLALACEKNNKKLIELLLGHQDKKKSKVGSKLSEKEACSICLDEFKDEKKVSKTSCNHFYCSDCIDDWIKNNNSCPLCRETVEKKGLITKTFLELKK